MFPPVDPTRRHFLSVVGGVDFTAETEAPPAQGRRKQRGPYKDHKPIEYQDGLPVIDPAGEEDLIFRDIAKHRAAVAHYDRCVTVEQEAEGKASSNEYSHLQHNTKNAFDDMMLWARAVIIDRPTTRRGLIHQVRYLASQFDEDSSGELITFAGGCTYLPDHVGERPWPMAFLQSLAAGLRKMAGELDAPKEGRRPRTSKNGTPEERAAKAAQEVTNPPADIPFISSAKPDLWSEVGAVLSKLNCKGLLPEAVKCLQVLLTRSRSAAAILARQPGSYVMSGEEVRKQLERLSENDRQYMTCYIQGLVDGRSM